MNSKEGENRGRNSAGGRTNPLINKSLKGHAAYIKGGKKITDQRRSKRGTPQERKEAAEKKKEDRAYKKDLNKQAREHFNITKRGKSSIK